VAGLHVVEQHATAGGPVVAFVHGGMDRSSSFGTVVRRLPDVHVLVYDRRGYARSQQVGPVARTLAAHTADLLGLLGGRPAVVIGHSYGGDVALLAAIEQPGLVRAVGAYEPPMPWMPWWPWGEETAGGLAVRAPSPESAAEAFMRRIVGDEVWEALPARTQADRRAEGATLLAELASIREQAPFDPAGVAVPVVLGVGTETDPHHRNGVEALAGTILGAEVVEINGAGHGAHVSHPDAFAAFVRTALERAAGRA
jgi:pimeloyl-ACP methyl ester carboxylesterase